MKCCVSQMCVETEIYQELQTSGYLFKYIFVFHPAVDCISPATAIDCNQANDP